MTGSNDIAGEILVDEDRIDDLEGERLGAYLERSGALAHPRAIDWLLQAAEVIAEAHALQSVHGSLNTQTLVLQNQPTGGVIVKVLGFGQRRSVTTDPSLLVAPEQLTGAPVDVRTDVWALGALLYEMLSGKPAFEGETYAAVAAQIIAGDVAPMSSRSTATSTSAVPREVASAIERCLRPRRDDRFADILALARELAPFGGETSRVSLQRIQATFGAPGNGATQAVQVNRSGARLPIFLGMFAVILVGFGMWSFTRSHVGDAKMHTTTPEQAQTALGAVVPPDERMDPSPSQSVAPEATRAAPAATTEPSPSTTGVRSTTDDTP
jgi:serine/threonine protein kinase